jgi:putative chitinase
MLISYEQLAEIMPHGAAARRIAAYVDPLNRGMAEFGITTPARIAAFVAQLAHESGEFRHVRELADGSAYEGRRDLGNMRSGDGRRFKGRGLLQITGRTNYTRVGKFFGVDFAGRPELLESPEWAARSACWYWRHGNGDLSPLADAGSFQLITRRINGGLNHYAERVSYWERARRVLGAALPHVRASSPAKSPDLVANVATGAGAIGATAYSVNQVSMAVDSARLAVDSATGFWGSVQAFMSSPALPWLLLLLAVGVLGFLAVRQYRRRRIGHEV